MFVSFTLASSPTKAWFFDKTTKAFASRPVLGYSLADTGHPEAVVLVPSVGVGVRVSNFSDFVAVLAADVQVTDAVAIDEVAAGLARAVSKEAAEEWKSSVTGVPSTKPVAAPVVAETQPAAQA